MPSARQQISRISDTICNAYTPETLARMVRVRLGERLYDVAGGENFRAVVFHLVEWAERQGSLAELVEAARAENPGNVLLAEVAAEFDTMAEARGSQTAAPTRWYMPFARSEALFGRAEELQRLHWALTGRPGDGTQAAVGNRLVGVTGMGGVGKTQLAVEYAYLHRTGYPDGVFWLNGAADLRTEFAALGVYLGLGQEGLGKETQIQAAADYLTAHPDSLLILDNVEDPRYLRQPLTRFLVPSALSCAVLFTTRRQDLGDFRIVALSGLPEVPGLQLLLRYSSRQGVQAADHPEHAEALAIYRMLGGLPLALEIAGAHLGRRPGASLAAYRQDLLARGAMAVVDDRRGGVHALDLGTRHAAAVAATLAEQWDGLGEDAQLLLRTAGQLPEAAAIPLARLGLLTGLKDEGNGFFGAPLAWAAHELVAASLLEDLRDDHVGLHPLVRDFASQQTAAAQRAGFCSDCASRLIASYYDFAVLEAQCAKRGIDALEQDLLTILALIGAAGSPGEQPAKATRLLRSVRQESHTLRGWDANQNPALFRVQWLKRALLLREHEWITRTHTSLESLHVPYLEANWTTAQNEASLVRTLSGHTDWICAVAVTPDDRHVISGAGDSTLRVWDLAGGEALRTFGGHGEQVNAVAVTPDGCCVVSGSADKTLRLWDLSSGECVRTLVGHDGPVHAVAMAPDGKCLISGADDAVLRVWDLETGNTLRTLKGHTDAARALTVTFDGRYVISGSDDHTLRVWNLHTGESLLVLEGHTGKVRTVAVTPDGRHAVSGSDDHTLRIWDLATGEAVSILAGHSDNVNAVAVTPDGRHIVSGASDSTLRVWDLTTGETLRVANGQAGAVRALAVAHDGHHAVSGAWNKTLQIWDLHRNLPGTLSSAEAFSSGNSHRGWVRTVAVTPDGRHAVWGSDDSTLQMRDIRTGAILHTLVGHAGSVKAVLVTTDGRCIVSASSDNTLRVWNRYTGENLVTLTGHSSEVNAAAVMPDGRHIVSGSGDNMLRVWDLGTGLTLRILAGHTGEVNAVAVLHDERHAVSGSDDHTLRVWDLLSGATVRVLAGHTNWVNAVALMPDGHHVVSGSADATLRVWNLHSGATVRVLTGHTNSVTAVTATPDGRCVVSASWDHTLRVWDLTDGVETARIALDATPFCLGLAEDGRTILTGDAAGNLWRLRYREQRR